MRKAMLPRRARPSQVTLPPVLSLPSRRRRFAVLARLPRVLLAWFAGSAAAYALASVAHTQTVLAALVALDVRIGPATRLTTTFDDLAGLWRYGVVIAFALGLGLLLARFALPRLAARRRDALAGALALACALLAMRELLSFTPIASARGAPGFSLQCAAGAAGGFVHAVVAARLSRPRPFRG